MSDLENVLEVWNNGATSPVFEEVKKIHQDPVRWVNEFCETTGAKYPISTRWTYNGQTYESPYCPKPLYLSNCLVEFHGNANELVVLNPDATIRHKIRPVWNLLNIKITPELKKLRPYIASTPTERDLGYYSASVTELGAGKFSVVCEDGIGDNLCVYDTVTGELLSFRRTRY